MLQVTNRAKSHMGKRASEYVSQRLRHGSGRKKARTVGKLMSKGINPVGLHVTMDALEGGEFRTLLGTVKKVILDPGPGYSERLLVTYFNGQPWPRNPIPSQVKVIE